MRGSCETIERILIAIDTNIVIRALTNDDPRQAERVRALFDREQLFVSTTVLLEVSWVLRSSYSYAASRASDALEAFIALPQVHLEHPDRARHALRLARQGYDFADALHHAGAADAGCEGFATFDRDLARLQEDPAVRLL